MLATLVALPVLTLLLVAYAVHPTNAVFAPTRLALIRAALIVTSGAIALNELLSAAHALTRGPLVTAWCTALAVTAVLAGWRFRRDGSPLPAPGALHRWAGRLWRGARSVEGILGIVLAGLVLAELVLALAAPPNNYDSYTYHLPKIEHWVAQHDLAFYQTSNQRQLSLAPGAEYLLLHMRLLTGGDAGYNLLQWSAAAACVLLASRIAGQLGGSQRAQLLAGFLFGTAPMVALQATSTQTDLVVAAWVGCVATLVLDQVRRRAGWADVLLLGAAVGLATLTKATGVLGAGPLLLIWLVAQVRQARADHPAAGRSGGTLAHTTLAALGVAVIAAGMNAPFLGRVADWYGSPFPANSTTMQRHDPQAVLVNALRFGHLAVEVPNARLRHASTRAVIHVADLVHVNVSDPKITFGHTKFPANSWLPDEDYASFPAQVVLVLIGALVLAIRPRRAGTGEPVPLRAYAGAFWLSLVLLVATIKWQPWGNRLILFALLLGAPLGGLWLAAVLDRAGAARASWRQGWLRWREAVTWRRAGAAALSMLVLVAAGYTGWRAVLYGKPRALAGSGSVFNETRMQIRFNRNQAWRGQFVDAAAAVRASGAHRIALIVGTDDWEYPWWLLLRGDVLVTYPVHTSYPPDAFNNVDAIVCNVPAQVCQAATPDGWLLHLEPGNHIGYVLPAEKTAPTG